MADHHAEQEQIEELKIWWKDNGSFVIAGIVAGVLAVGGYWGWRNYTIKRAELASETYENLLDAVELSDRDRALELGRILKTDYGSTPYAAQAGLALAKFHVQSQEPEEAAEQLEKIVSDADDDLLTHVARLRLARVRLDQGRPEDALAVLDGVEPGVFAPRYHEVRGDIQLAIGDTNAARLEYISAMATFKDNIVDRPTLQMKLDDIALASEADSGTEEISGETAAENPQPEAAPES